MAGRKVRKEAIKKDKPFRIVPVKMEHVFFGNRGEQLAGWLHYPRKLPAPAVVVCHGFTSSSFTKKDTCNYLAQKGFLALRFDFNGHGESYGSFRDLTITRCVNDLHSAVDFVKSLKTCNGRIGVTGSSLGGIVLMIYAASHEINAAVPVSSPFSMDGTTLMNKTLVDEWKKKGYKNFPVRGPTGIKQKKPLSYNFVTDRLKYNMEILSRRIACPVLLVHGNIDKIVPASHSRLYFKKLELGVSKKKLVILKGAGHNNEFRPKDTEKMLVEAGEWFRKFL